MNSPPTITPMLVHGQQLYGLAVDVHTRCEHYHTLVDIIAIKFYCCGVYYPCHACHAALAGHEAIAWPKAQWQQPAVLCGQCGTELTVAAYLQCNNSCPSCSATFNAGCAAHYPLYFQV